MPLPKPNSGENEKDFVSRCAGNPTMNKEFPDSTQRIAVCHQIFRGQKKKSEMEQQVFSFQELEIRTEGEAEGVFEGYAAVFDEINSHREIILPGAFKDSLGKRGAQGIKMLFSHDSTLPIGKWTEVREDTKGLFVRGRLLLQLEKAREALLLMQEKILDGLSIGFRTIEESFDSQKNAFMIRKLELREVSPVLLPSADGALISKVRDASPDELTTKRDLENVLRDAGFTRSTVRYIVAGWEPPARRDDAGNSHQEAIASLLVSMSTAKGT